MNPWLRHNSADHVLSRAEAGDHFYLVLDSYREFQGTGSSCTSTCSDQLDLSRIWKPSQPVQIDVPPPILQGGSSQPISAVSSGVLSVCKLPAMTDDPDRSGLRSNAMKDCSIQAQQAENSSGKGRLIATIEQRSYIQPESPSRGLSREIKRHSQLTELITAITCHHPTLVEGRRWVVFVGPGFLTVLRVPLLTNCWCRRKAQVNTSDIAGCSARQAAAISEHPLKNSKHR